MNQRGKTILAATGGFLLLVGCAGCGTKEYEERLDRTVSQLRADNPDRPAATWTRAEAPLGQTGVVVHLPVVVSAEALGPEVVGFRKTIPWLGAVQPVSVHEGSAVDSAGGARHFQLFLAHSSGDPRGPILQQLNAKFPNTQAQWRTVACPTSDGQTADWQVAEASGAEQEVYYVDAKGIETNPLEKCKVLVYVRTINEQTIILVWRVPTAIAGEIFSEGIKGLDEWAKRTAGGVTTQ